MLYTHKHLNILAAVKTKNPDNYLSENNFSTIYKILWQDEEVIRDKRSAKEIISDTLKDFGIKIKRGSDK